MSSCSAVDALRYTIYSISSILSWYQLGANGNAQQIYELTFILWTLSLGCEEKDLPLFLSAGNNWILPLSTLSTVSQNKFYYLPSEVKSADLTNSDKIDFNIVELLVPPTLHTTLPPSPHTPPSFCQLLNSILFSFLDSEHSNFLLWHCPILFHFIGAIRVLFDLITAAPTRKVRVSSACLSSSWYLLYRAIQLHETLYFSVNVSLIYCTPSASDVIDHRSLFCLNHTYHQWSSLLHLPSFHSSINAVTVFAKCNLSDVCPYTGRAHVHGNPERAFCLWEWRCAHRDAHCGAW